VFVAGEGFGVGMGVEIIVEIGVLVGAGVGVVGLLTSSSFKGLLFSGLVWVVAVEEGVLVV